MIKKLFFACALALIAVGGSVAQTRSVEQLLAPTRQLISGKGCQTASFHSTLTDRAGRTLEQQSGTMYLQGSSFRLEFGPITAVFSGKQLAHYNKDEHTLTISQPSAEELVLLNPLYFLRSYTEKYRAATLPESKTGPMIGFTPLKKGNVKSIELQLDRAQLKPREVVVLSTDGYRLVIKIEQLQATAEREAGFFTLKASAYPGVEVIDLE